MLPGSFIDTPLPSIVDDIPVLWLDASHLGKTYANADGTVRSIAGGPVALWIDRSPSNNHVLFDGTGAMWSEPAQGMGGRPTLAIADANPGVFAISPFAANEGLAFTALMVWRITSGGGHPLSINGAGQWSTTIWEELLGFNNPRNFPAPSSLGFSVGSTVVLLVERSITGDTIIRLNTTHEGGRYWTQTSPTTDTDWRTRPFTLGSTGKGLELAELLVWNVQLNMEKRLALGQYLTERWGVVVASSGGIAGTIPESAIVHRAYTWSATDNAFKADGTPAISNGDFVANWYSTEWGEGDLRIVPSSTATNYVVIGTDSDGKRFVRDENATIEIGMLLDVMLNGVNQIPMLGRSYFLVFATEFYGNIYFMHKGLPFTSNPPNGGFALAIPPTQIRITINNIVYILYTVEGGVPVANAKSVWAFQTKQVGSNIEVWFRYGTMGTPVTGTYPGPWTDSDLAIRFGHWGNKSYTMNIYHMEFTSSVMSMEDFDSKFNSLKVEYMVA